MAYRVFIMLYKTVLTLTFLEGTPVSNHSNVSFPSSFTSSSNPMLCKVVLTAKSLNGIPVCDSSRYNFRAVPLTGTVCL